jgi:hypothetical protein
MLFEPIQYIAAAVAIFALPSIYDAARRYIASRRASPYSKPVSRNEAEKVRLWHMQAELDEREKQVAAREQQQSSLEGKLASAGAELEGANRKNAQVNEELAKLGVAYADAEGTISTMTGKLSACEASLAEKSAQLEAKEAQEAAPEPETAETPAYGCPEPQPVETAPQKPNVAPQPQDRESSILEFADMLDSKEELCMIALVERGFFLNENAARVFIGKHGFEPAKEKQRVQRPDGSEARRWTKKAAQEVAPPPASGAATCAPVEETGGASGVPVADFGGVGGAENEGGGNE